jgi:hypothetical protein
MTDLSNEPSGTPKDDPLQALRELANSPRLLTIANTQTTFETVRTGLVNETSATTIVNVRELAESVMFDATRLVTKLDELSPRQTGEAIQSQSDMVSIPSVLRGGAAVTLAFALVCMVGTQLSGTVFLHPLLAGLLIVSSLGFYLMASLKK